MGHETGLRDFRSLSAIRGRRCAVWLSWRRTGDDRAKSGERERFVSAVRIVRYRLSLILLAGLAAGCSHSGKTDQSNVVQTAAPPPPTVAMAPEAVQPHVKKPKAPAAPHAQIDELIGWNESELTTVFGTPASQEDHAPTKQLIYHVKQCTLNVTLYPEVETKQFHALNYEVNSDDGSAKRQQACIAEFTSRLPTKPISN
jgi:hypothetical protein